MKRFSFSSEAGILRPMQNFQSKSVLIAGCSSPLGMASAIALARRGHQVIAGIREPEARGLQAAQQLAQIAQEETLLVHTVALDVDQSSSVHAAVEAARKLTGDRLQVLVNMAAYAVLGPLEACHPDQLLDMLNTNVVGALRLFRGVLPLMRAQSAGRIVQITSGLGRAVLPFMAPYAASAWAQECFAEALAMEAQSFGVQVAILEPAAYREGGGPTKPVGDADRLAPYEAQLIALAEHLQSQGGGGEDPDELVAAVVHAVEAQSQPLRTVVGRSAQELVALRKSLPFEAYEREVRRRAGLLPSVERPAEAPTAEG